MKKTMLAGVMAVVVAALAGIQSVRVSAQQDSTFSVAVHIEYPDGFVYDGIFARGVPAPDLHTFLAACGESHKGGSWLHYHCYPIPE